MVNLFAKASAFFVYDGVELNYGFEPDLLSPT
jgi:hypothetical protein